LTPIYNTLIDFSAASDVNFMVWTFIHELAHVLIDGSTKLQQAKAIPESAQWALGSQGTTMT